MNCLIWDGERKEEQLLKEPRRLLERELGEMGHDVETVPLRELEIAPCKGCFGCWVATPGVCTSDDESREITRKLVESDLVVFLTPITFGGYSSELKKALDRSIPILLPFFTQVDGQVRHPMRYEKLPRILALGVLPGSDEEGEEIFRGLIARNAENLHGTDMAVEVLVTDRPEQLLPKIRSSLEGALS